LTNYLEERDNLDSWSIYTGGGTIEIAPSGTLHVLPPLSGGAWLERNDWPVSCQISFYFRLKIDQFSDSGYLELVYGLYNTKEMVFQVLADHTRYMATDSEWKIYTIETDTEYHDWKLEVDFISGLLTVYRDGSFLVKWTAGFPVGEVEQRLVISAYTGNDPMKYHMDYLYLKEDFIFLQQGIELFPAMNIEEKTLTVLAMNVFETLVLIGTVLKCPKKFFSEILTINGILWQVFPIIYKCTAYLLLGLNYAGTLYKKLKAYTQEKLRGESSA